MTIRAIYKVEGDSNEYNSEREAQIAECIQNSGTYLRDSQIVDIAKTISEKYFLCPMVKTETVVVTQAEIDQGDIRMFGASQ